MVETGMFEGDVPRGRAGKVAGFGEQLFAPGIQRIALPIVSYSLILFFLIQGPVIFPDQWSTWGTVTMIYALFLVPVLIMSLMNVAPFNLPAWKVLMWFGITFAGGFVLFKLLFSGFKYGTGLPLGALLPTIVFNILVIGMAEESFFRGFLLTIGKQRLGIGVFASAAMFSVFHLAAYGVGGSLNFIALFVAFVMGLAFGFVYVSTRDFAGIGMVLGLHAAWNIVLLFG